MSDSRLETRAIARSAGRSDGWAVMAAMTLGMLNAFAAPVYVGAFMEGLRLSEARASLLSSVETATLALACIAMRNAMSVWPPRTLAHVGFGLVVLAQAITIAAESYAILIVARCLAGAGAACLLTVSTSLIAAADDPDRAYGRSLAAASVVAAASLLLMPGTIGLWGHRGTFAAMLICIVLVALPLAGIPARRPFEPAAIGAGVSRSPSAALIVLFAGVALVFASQGGVWFFAERIGHSLGLTQSQVGIGLALGTLSGFFGALAVGVNEQRWGRSATTVLSVAAQCLCIALITFADGFSSYATGLFLYGASFMGTNTLMLATMAAVDQTGSLSTLMFGWILLTYAGGAWSFGLVLETTSTTTAGSVAIAACAVGLAVLIAGQLRILASVPARVSPPLR